MSKVKADQRAGELAAWRARHFEQLELSLQAAIKTRDDPQTKAKDRNEAIKIIGRFLDALSPERVGSVPPPAKGKEEQKPTADEWEQINERLNAK